MKIILALIIRVVYIGKQMRKKHKPITGENHESITESSAGSERRNGQI
jgi:hypothetical protein